jgi:hypothetical protein
MARTKTISAASAAAKLKQDVKNMAKYAAILENLIRNAEHTHVCNHRLGYLCNCHVGNMQATMQAASEALNDDS